MRVQPRSDPVQEPGGPSETDLVQRCLEGDTAAWDALVRIYWKRVFNIAYKFVAQVDEAEDLTQEIFVKLFRALPTFDRRASFDTWLTRVSRNLCIDRYRRRRREEERFTDEVDPDTIPLDALVARPDASLEQRDQVAMVRRALARLPPAYREAVALRGVGIGADYRTFFVHRDESTPRVHRFAAGLTLSLK